MTYSNGDEYVVLAKGRRPWNATKTYPHGDKYTGMWKNDKREGKGTGFFANGDIYFGMGKMVNLKAKEH